MNTRAGMRGFVVATDKIGLSEVAARYVAACSKESIAARGRFVCSLAGGSTPRDLYERLARAPYLESIEWSKWFVLFGDERCVPPHHADSNFKMANDALLSHVGLRRNAVIRVDGEAEPRVAAERYADALKKLFAKSGDSAIDLSLLGMGDDGHTASLFPDVIESCLDEDSLATAVYPTSKQTWRVTLNLPTLCAARKTLFLVAGAGKRTMLQRVTSGDATLPATRVANEARDVLFFADAAAAS